MARPPAPPGPPPPHYRPPGPPPPSLVAPPEPLGAAPSAPAGASGVGPGAATGVATVMLLIGLVAGFYVGRAYDDETAASSGPVLTVPDRPPTTSPPRTGDTIPQRSPDAPPATDLPPEGLGTIESPVPVGQAYVLGLYEIEVLAVDRDATAALAEHDAGNPAPPAGAQHVLVQVAVRFTDAAGLGNPAAIPFFVSDGDGLWSTSESTCGDLPTPLAEAGLLEQGDEAVGNVCFTVPSRVVDDVALGTESFAGPLYFALP